MFDGKCFARGVRGDRRSSGMGEASVREERTALVVVGGGAALGIRLP